LSEFLESENEEHQTTVRFESEMRTIQGKAVQRTQVFCSICHVLLAWPLSLRVRTAIRQIWEAASHREDIRIGSGLSRSPRTVGGSVQTMIRILDVRQDGSWESRLEDTYVGFFPDGWRVVSGSVRIRWMGLWNRRVLSAAVYLV